MDQRLVCCRDLPANIPCPSPFDELVIFDYYDGPLEGLATCTACAAEYWFETVAKTEDLDAREVRLFRVPEGSTATIKEVLASKDPDGRQIWSPIWKFSSEEVEKRAEEVLASIRRSVSEPYLQLVWSSSTDRILSASRCNA